MSQSNCLNIRGLPVPPSIMLAHMAENERIRRHFSRVDFSVWSASTALRQDVESGRVDLAVVPTNVAAAFYNQGLPVRFLAVTVWGILHVVASTEKIKSWPDLAGRTIAIPFKGNMPDTIFRFLAGKNGLDPDRDLQLVYTDTYVDAKNVLLEGRAEAACLPEPVASAALFEADRRSAPLFPGLDLQREWQRSVGPAPRYAQAGLLVRTAVLDQAPDIAGDLLSACREALGWMADSPEEAGIFGAPLLGGLAERVVSASLGRMDLEAGAFPDSIPDVENFLNILSEMNRELVPGGLPEHGFYLQT